MNFQKLKVTKSSKACICLYFMGTKQIIIKILTKIYLEVKYSSAILHQENPAVVILVSANTQFLSILFFRLKITDYYKQFSSESARNAIQNLGKE